MDRVLLSTSKDNLIPFRDQAARYGFGLELQAFSEPHTLAYNLSTELEEHRQALTGFSGEIGIHGAFYDLTSASPDPAIQEVTRRRYRQNLRIASELNARYVLFHLNYLGNCKIPNFRSGWHEREVDFWSSFVLEAEKAGVPILIENSWEDEPSLITDILAEVNSPYLLACLDVAHATLYSEYSLEEWIKACEPWLFCSHLNNHNGQLDLHWPLNKGLVDYSRALELLRSTGKQPFLCLEMSQWSQIETSLSFFDLSPSIRTEVQTVI